MQVSAKLRMERKGGKEMQLTNQKLRRGNFKPT